MDRLSPVKRSKLMSSIPNRNTKPEVTIRSALHAAGYRYRLNKKVASGRPDIVLPKHNVIVLVHGCFWHGHGCPDFKWPRSNAEFWKNKIEKNVERDKSNLESYQKEGWRVVTVWECSLRGKNRKLVEEVLEEIVTFRNRHESVIEIHQNT